MCTGFEFALLAGGLAATAGGTALERSDAKKNAAAIAMARNQALRDNTARQRRYEDTSRAEGVQKALDRFSPEEQQRAQAADVERRDVAINEAVVPTAGVEDIPLEGSTVPVVKDQIGKKLRDVFNSATARAKLNARPASYSDMIAGNNIALGGAGRVVDTQNSFARQEAAMLGAQQDFAAYLAQREPSIWGPVLKTAGQAAMAAGGSGVLGGARLAAAPALAAAVPTTFSASAPLAFPGYYPGAGTYPA